MLYDFTLTVAAGKTKTAPAVQRMKLSKGIIHRVEVEFYPGPRRYVEVAIFRGGYQLWPSNADGVFSSDGYTIAFDEDYELKDEPTELVAKGWSPDADYSHDVIIRIGLLESRTALLMLEAIKGMSKLFKFFGIKV